jgi:porphobilinogen synthase
MSAKFPSTRLRRLRHHEAIRTLIRETTLQVNDVILPLFIRYGKNIKQPILSMPGHFQLSIDQLRHEILGIKELAIPGVILFAIPEHKDEVGSDAYCDHGIIQQAIHEIKAVDDKLLVISDLCFCEYTTHGHCGIVNEKNGIRDIDNDATLEILAKQAISHAKAGADILAPSGMMDGMVQVIRKALDEHDYQHLPILSYAVKYASAFYGPFREAAEGAPQFGDRKTYQADYANAGEALREAELDVSEGADMLMVKPALPYLDIIHRVKNHFPGIPLGAYQVSGEFAMIEAAARNGWIDKKKTVLESLTAIKRAGADFIISYFAKDLAKWLR